MHAHVIALDDLDRTAVNRAGGKAANLGELMHIDGVRVPAGFCVTTEAFRRDTVMPEALAAAIRERIGSGAYAVRSSATAEDMPTASFAGQYDTYLNIRGADAVLAHVRKCWASLANARAIAYCRENRIADSDVLLAVVVQEMVAAESSGVAFSADPLSGHRRVVAIDAAFGLGDALVSGRVNADHYKVRDGRIVASVVRGLEVLREAQIIELDRTARRIEGHFGAPQDIEWCWAGDALYIVQSRPITTLYPVPARAGTKAHVYISVAHQQMMTDPMTPLGLSIFQLTAARPMFAAGGRLFVDVGDNLAAPATRRAFIDMLGQHEPLIKAALTTLIERGDFGPGDDGVAQTVPSRPPIAADPAIVAELIARNRASVAALEQAITGSSAIEVFDCITNDIAELKKAIFDQTNLAVIMAAAEAVTWLNANIRAWLGDINVADALSQAAPGNVTAEMGLALLDVADVVRAFPEVVAYLQQRTHDDRFLTDIAQVNGGAEARRAIDAYLAAYGMRCVGEIDIARRRWSEAPSTLIPLIVSNIKNFSPGEAARRVARGRAEAARTERDILERLERLPDGDTKAKAAKQMIDRIRVFSGYREYPKYGIISRYAIYKTALHRAATRLTAALTGADDIYFLTFAELREAVRTGVVDSNLIDERKSAQHAYARLVPPRVMTGDGEIVSGTYDRAHLPPGALPGLAVSSGVVEGRARVIHDLGAADLVDGDILVTAFTDPSWTPAFMSIKGLVTEVGGLMTHGAVIAREYGLPAVVAVEGATRLIRDGERIRVNGSEGYVELLGD